MPENIYYYRKSNLSITQGKLKLIVRGLIAVKVIKVILLVLISLLMVVVGWAYLAFMSIESTLLNEDYYEDLFIETDVASRFYYELQDFFVDIVIDNVSADMDHEELSAFKEEENLYFYSLNAFLDMIETAWIEKQLQQVFIESLAFIKGDQEDLDLIISLGVNEDVLRLKMVNEISKLSTEQLKELGGHTHPAIVEAKAARVIRELGFFNPIKLNQVHDIIPNEVDNIIKLYQDYKSSVYYISYIFFGLALVFMMFLAKPAKGLIWFGVTTIIFSLSFLFGIQVLKNDLPDFLLSRIHESGLFISVDLIQLIVFYIAESINYIAFIAVAVGLVFLLIGLIWSLIISKKNSSLSMEKAQNDYNSTNAS